MLKVPRKCNYLRNNCVAKHDDFGLVASVVIGLMLITLVVMFSGIASVNTEKFRTACSKI